jgi:hypothetical protein
MMAGHVGSFGDVVPVLDSNKKTKILPTTMTKNRTKRESGQLLCDLGSCPSHVYFHTPLLEAEFKVQELAKIA